MACAAGRQVEMDQDIKALRDAPSADSLNTDTATGVGARGTVAGGFSARYTPLPAWSRLARGAGRVGGRSLTRAVPGCNTALVSEAFLPR